MRYVTGTDAHSGPKTGLFVSFSSRKRTPISVAWSSELDPQHAAAYVSLLQNHNVKERRPGISPRARARKAEARRKRAETVPGPGGRRGFYARLTTLSTTFSRKRLVCQSFKKRLKNQRDFCALGARAIRANV
jgi:hypothetical protein